MERKPAAINLMEKPKIIYIAGINGMVGSAIKRRQESEGFTNIIGYSSKELDLTSQVAFHDLPGERKAPLPFPCSYESGRAFHEGGYKRGGKARA
jgi:hypothetical protein